MVSHGRASIPQPPYSADLLADLHADNVAPDVAAQLWPLVRKDPDAQAILATLDADRIAEQLANLTEPAAGTAGTAGG